MERHALRLNRNGAWPNQPLLQRADGAGRGVVVLVESVRQHFEERDGSGGGTCRTSGVGWAGNMSQ